jgi:phosphatidylglycerol:prolipoprotein diacylglycerol transferase
MYPVILHLGPLTIYSYGLMMAIGFMTATYLTGREMSRKGLDGELASTMVFWAALGGLAGARLVALVHDWSGVVSDPIHAIFSGAGFVWYGGLIGGFLAVSWTMRQHRLPWLKTVDCIAPGLALAHGIGRIGCQLAGDGDWGGETTLPWGMAYPNAIVGWHYAPGVRVHPTPLYELFAYVGVFAFLWSIRKRPHADGALFWWYLVLAGGARFLVEFVRINTAVLLGLTEAQLISLALMTIGSWRLRSAVRPTVRTTVPLQPSKLSTSKQ